MTEATQVRSLVGGRILRVHKPGPYRTDVIDEARVLEVSPSGEWTRLMNEHGSKYWTRTDELKIVEILTYGPVEPKPAPKSTCDSCGHVFGADS